jgi:lipopolysaccharide biosynthesis glycosyltransferase
VDGATGSSGSALVFAADDNFAEGLAVALHSALVHLGPMAAPEVYLLDNGLSERSWAKLRRIADRARPGLRLRGVEVAADRLGPIAKGSHLSPASYARLLLAEAVEPHVRRAVYLDVDVLVRRDLSPLFTLDLGGALVAAVRDYYTSSTAHEMSGVRDRSNPRPYFNTGVLVIDVERWRGTGLADRILEYAQAGPEPLRFADQDALNGVIDNWCELDYRWNVQQLPRHIYAREWPRELTESEQYAYRHRRELFRAAAVVHFISSIKPWRYSCATAGTWAWVVGLIRSGWYSPGELAAWLVRWQVPRLRYRIGRSMQRMQRPPDELGSYDRLSAGRK